MAKKPWEKYANTQEKKPWEKYAKTEEPEKKNGGPSQEADGIKPPVEELSPLQKQLNSSVTDEAERLKPKYTADFDKQTKEFNDSIGLGEFDNQAEEAYFIGEQQKKIKELSPLYESRVNAGEGADKVNADFQSEVESWATKEYKSPLIEAHNKKINQSNEFKKKKGSELDGLLNADLQKHYTKLVNRQIAFEEGMQKADDRREAVDEYNLAQKYPAVTKLKSALNTEITNLTNEKNKRIEEFTKSNPSESELKEFAEAQEKELDKEIEPEYQKFRGTLEQFKKDPDFAKGFQEKYQSPNQTVGAPGAFGSSDPTTSAIIRKGWSTMMDLLPGSVAGSIAGSMSPDFDQQLLSSRGWREDENSWHVPTKEEARDEYIKKVGKDQYEKEKAEFVNDVVGKKDALMQYEARQSGEGRASTYELPDSWEEAKRKGGVGMYGYIGGSVAQVGGLIAPTIAASIINPYLGMGVAFGAGAAIEKNEAYKGGLELIEEKTGMSRKELFAKDMDELLREESSQSGLINGLMEYASTLTMVGKFLPKGILINGIKKFLDNKAVQAPFSVAFESFTEWVQAKNTEYAKQKGLVDESGKPVYTDEEAAQIAWDTNHKEDAIGGAFGSGGIVAATTPQSLMVGKERADRFKRIKQLRSLRDGGIGNTGATTTQTTGIPVQQNAEGQNQQTNQDGLQQDPPPAGQPDAKEPAAVLENNLNLETQSLNDGQGNKIDPLSPGAEQKGGGSQQEDAEVITRGVQEAIPGTPGAQRSAREIKKEQDLKLEADAIKKGTFIENVKETFGEKLDGGTEQDVYESKDGSKVIKVNSLANHSGWAEFWQRLKLQKSLFPETSYKLIGFTKAGGRLSAVIEQPLINGTAVPRKELIDDLAKRGFYQIHPEGSPGENQFYNPESGIRLTDVHGENVIKDADGNIRYIDPMLDYENPFVDEKSKQYFNEQVNKPTEPELTLESQQAPPSRTAEQIDKIASQRIPTKDKGKPVKIKVLDGTPVDDIAIIAVNDLKSRAGIKKGQDGKTAMDILSDCLK